MLSDDEIKTKITLLTQAQKDEFDFLSSEIKSLGEESEVNWKAIKKLVDVIDQLGMIQRDLTETYISLLKQGYQDIDG
jgi:uncharacterized protein YaaN involved in tellurite resistance